MSDETLTTSIENREVVIRAINEETRTVEGIAVPYGQEANIGGKYRERFERDSILAEGDIHLYWQHDYALPIGKVIEGRSEEEGFIVKAYISETSLGNDVYALVKDGTVRNFSIGFVPVESSVEEDNLVVRKIAKLSEVSLVPQPAYEGAEVTLVRNEQDSEMVQQDQINSEKESDSVMENEITNSELDVAEVRSALENLERKFDLISAPAPEVAVEKRSAGEVLKAIAAGDEALVRAYAGGTTADAVVRNPWVGDLTRIVDEAAVLRGIFSRGALPAEGNYIEYGVLKSNSVDVDVQAAEGDDLAFGLVQVEAKTAPVKTYGGYSTLSRQEIERASVNMVDHTLRAMAVAAGKALNAAARTHFEAEVDAQVTAGNDVVIPATGVVYSDWLDAIIEASVKFDALGLTLDGLAVDKATFKALMALEASDGRPVFNITGAGVNNIGALDIRALTGQVANIPVVMDAGLSEGYAAFYNRGAITEFTSPVVRLQDDNIINLSRDFSVYMYSAVGTTIDGAIVPVSTESGS